MAHPSVPGEERVRETIISEIREGLYERRADNMRQPSVAGRAAPDFDRAIGADIETPIGRYAMETPAHIIHIYAKTRERIRFKIDVAKKDRAVSRRVDEPIALPIYTAVTNRAFGVVPDRQRRKRIRYYFAAGVQTTELSLSTKQIDIMPERKSTRNTPPSPLWREATRAYSETEPAFAPSPGG